MNTIIEEKAKAYDEAIERAKEMIKAMTNIGGVAKVDDIQYLFPELRESDDERIRKWLYDYISNCPNNNFAFYGGVGKDAVLNYLEKQKENIEKEYVFRPLAGTDITTAANQAVRRANEGDHLVLAFNGAYIPVKKGCNTSKIVDMYDAFIKKQKEPDGTWTEEDDVKVRAMCKEGDLKPSEIAWLKELKNRIVKKEQKPEEIDEYKIIKKHITEDSLSSEVNKRLTECGWYVSDEKPEEWSEEDKFKLEDAITGIDAGIGFYETEGKHPNLLKAIIEGKEWLKSLPERFNLQSKQGWNGDDNVLLNNIINIIQNKKYVNDDTARKIYVDFLKSLRPKHEIHKEKTKEPKHTEVWVEGRTIFEQDANTFVNTEGESEAKLTGWVARDEDEKIWVYETCPEKYSDWQQWVGNDGSMRLDQKSFPDLKWEDEPVEVEITIRKK